MATQYAYLFGFDCIRCDPDEQLEFAGPKPGKAMLALSYRTLRYLGPDQLVRLRETAKAGAVVYIRGGFDGTQQCTLSPLIDATFLYVKDRRATAYRIEARWPMPEVLHGENSGGEFLLPSARGIPDQWQVLASAQFESGECAPFLFAIRCGAGYVICDLLADAPAGSPDTPILYRLANPAKRYRELGPLASIRIAAGVSPSARPAFNLTMDDRPANFDLLNSGNLRRWLEHVESRFHRAHVDFAWTPDQLYPARSFVEMLKRFNTGIVWHGFKRHVNHSGPLKFENDLRQGALMVGRISRRFDVNFQPIMVFPFEAFGLEALSFLKQAGFVATVAGPLPPGNSWSNYPSFVHRSVPLEEEFANVFPVLRRYSCESLSRDLMLSHAALNLPIIVVVHPDEIGMRRWPYPPLRKGTRTHSDSVLSFAAAKRLRAASLEEIAQEIVSRPRPKAFELRESCRTDAKHLH
ncbi:MAG: hypothetical protein Q7S58_09765 [Candidatus Binatus sp.]|uniref:hypothetical protein n=1 Tax=Candidatus Binatus sp. TaxID=2811406 RepID=UPI00271CF8EF|nr:hypothetical protein [Candidatus Binatus sp.]MDO8432682.1 hypothetical protein [Candidatus Binatus sp.]